MKMQNSIQDLALITKTQSTILRMFRYIFHLIKYSVFWLQHINRFENKEKSIKGVKFAIYSAKNSH